jgi:hypothetical protein
MVVATFERNTQIYLSSFLNLEDDLNIYSIPGIEIKTAYQLFLSVSSSMYCKIFHFVFPRTYNLVCQKNVMNIFNFSVLS